jgi:HAD superfamily hydrolase (TIGR01509 family)
MVEGVSTGAGLHQASELLQARPMIRAFVFDIGNVILRFDFTLALDRLRQHRGGETAEVLHQIEPVKVAYESGAITRPEFLQRIGVVIRHTGTHRELVAAWEDIFTENEPMIALIEQLHGRFPLYLLSNTSDLHVEYMLRTYPVFSRFDDAVYSHVAKCLKPGREIFRIAIRQFGITPEATVYVDDLAPNVATAAELGFAAILYDHANHGALLAELSRLGVDIPADQPSR